MGITLFLLTLFVPGLIQAATFEQRLQRMEQILENRTLLQMLDRIEALQRENSELRAMLEEQAWKLEQLNRRQQELYLDLDQRLQQMERGMSVTGTAIGEERRSTSGLTSPASSAATTVAIAPSPEEQQAYQAAFTLMSELNYPKAREAFSTFIRDYPQSQDRHIARYWLAEASYMLKDYQRALEAYEQLLQEAPNGGRAADAMLKQVYCYRELKQPQQAEAIARQLQQRFGETPEAAVATSSTLLTPNPY